MKTLRLRFDGTCAGCGRAVAAGEPAGYDAVARSVTCAACLARAGVPLASRAAVGEQQPARAWATGAEGEAHFGAKLDAVRDVIVLHDRRIPGSTANLDHIAVTAGGIYVIDAMDYAGRIELRTTRPFGLGAKRLYVGRRDCTALAERMPRRVDAVRLALARLAEADGVAFTAVLCFLRGDWSLVFPPHAYAGVLIEGEGSLCRLLRRGGPLGADERRVIARHLARTLPAASATS